jgi:hypothetical protein
VNSYSATTPMYISLFRETVKNFTVYISEISLIPDESECIRIAGSPA